MKTRHKKTGTRFVHGPGSNKKRLKVNQHQFFYTQYKHLSNSVQCQHCGSDNTRFAVDGYQRQAKFWVRKSSEVAEQIVFGGQP